MKNKAKISVFSLLSEALLHAAATIFPIGWIPTILASVNHSWLRVDVILQFF